MRSMSSPPPGYPVVAPYLLYEDAASAVAFLTRAFGFEVRLAQEGAAGRTHYELVIEGDGLVMLGQANESFKNPASLDAFPPSMVHVYVPDVEAVAQRATAAGVDVGALELAPNGDRRFTVADPEGEMWVFAERVR
jgi:PhnB protein